MYPRADRPYRNTLWSASVQEMHRCLVQDLSQATIWTMDPLLPMPFAPIPACHAGCVSFVCSDSPWNELAERSWLGKRSGGGGGALDVLIIFFTICTFYTPVVLQRSYGRRFRRRLLGLRIGKCDSWIGSGHPTQQHLTLPTTVRRDRIWGGAKRITLVGCGSVLGWNKRRGKSSEEPVRRVFYCRSARTAFAAEEEGITALICELYRVTGDPSWTQRLGGVECLRQSEACLTVRHFDSKLRM